MTPLAPNSKWPSSSFHMEHSLDRLPCLAASLVLVSLPVAAQRLVPLGPNANVRDLTIDASNRPTLVGFGQRIVIEADDSLTLTSLGVVTPGAEVYGNAITADGTRVVGSTELPASSSYEAVIWNGTTPTVLSAPQPQSTLVDVATSPSSELIAVGRTGPLGAGGIDQKPYVWNSSVGATPLPDPRGISDFHGEASSLSEDGSIAIGTVTDPGLGLGRTLPTIWHLQAPGFQGEILAGAPGSEYARCSGVSPNGRSFAGQRKMPTQAQLGVVWLEGDGQALRELSDPSGTALFAAAGHVADDGFVVGGQVMLNPGIVSASWVWHPSFPSNDYQMTNAFLASRGVNIGPTISNTWGFKAEGGEYHLVVEDENDDWYYVSVPDFGPNTNTNPAVTILGTGSFGGFSYIPRLRMLGAGVPGTFQTLTLRDLSPDAAGSVAILGLSNGVYPLPGALGIQLDLSILLDTFVLPVTVPSGTDFSGGYIRLFAPPSVVAGGQFYFQAVALYPGGWAASEVLQVTIQ